MLVGVQIVQVVRLFAELNTGCSPPKLLNQKRVVPLHNLPNQLSWNGRHDLLLALKRDGNGSKEKSSKLVSQE